MKIAPPMIDLALAGAEPDGTVVYDSPWNALPAQIQRGIIELIREYPQETLHAADFCLRAVALAGIVGLCSHLLHEPEKRRAGARQDAFSKAR